MSPSGGLSGGEEGTGDRARPAGGDFAALAPELARRIGSILETVQREADRMLEQSRREALRRVEEDRRRAEGRIAERERRIERLSEELTTSAEAIAGQLRETERACTSFGRLLHALGEAADRATDELTAAPAPAEPGLSDPVGGPAGSAPDVETTIEARQAAIQMAAAGATRAQVESHLRGFMRVADPRSLLDAVYGIDSSGESRVPWAIAPPAPAREEPSSGSASSQADASASRRRRGRWLRR